MKVKEKDKEKSNLIKKYKINNYKPKKITKRRNAIDDSYFIKKWENKILDDIIELEHELNNKINNIINEHNYSLKIN
ncbi:hypothetical protein [Spiroplasma ixodetis]|uniref:Uncharacterized protein n=1 Tax=Spiroplasma ixodetis TaxID=2141 RepID=A0ABM8BZ95_9MOLU|nr:hypothetical protein [Spiroplasma ixodetis]BDT05057.1 hypothetical protein SHM_27030 [Spiroplasma ixodetis]